MAVLESEVDQHVTQLAAQLGPKAHSWLRSSLRGKRYSDLPSKLQRERVRESSRELCARLCAFELLAISADICRQAPNMRHETMLGILAAVCGLTIFRLATKCPFS